jgi:hypothetical protein
MMSVRPSLFTSTAYTWNGVGPLADNSDVKVGAVWAKQRIDIELAHATERRRLHRCFTWILPQTNNDKYEDGNEPGY